MASVWGCFPIISRTGMAFTFLSDRDYKIIRPLLYRLDPSVDITYLLTERVPDAQSTLKTEVHRLHHTINSHIFVVM